MNQKRLEMLERIYRFSLQTSKSSMKKCKASKIDPRKFIQKLYLKCVKCDAKVKCELSLKININTHQNHAVYFWAVRGSCALRGNHTAYSYMSLLRRTYMQSDLLLSPK